MAAKEERRGMILYIDGAEINNSLKSIRSEMSKLTNQQAIMTRGSDEYVEAASKIKALKSILAEHSESVKAHTSLLDKLKDSAMELLPVLSFAAVAEGFVGAFEKIKSSTKATSDLFEFAMAGMSTGLDFFWKTLATGNWTGFFSNLNKAIEGGYNYAKMLDDVAVNSKALRIIESNARGEELRLEEDLKNKGLSIEARTKAGKDRIKLEEKLSEDRQLIANKNYKAEFDEATRVTALNESQLLSVAGVIESEEKLQASAFNEKVDYYNKIKSLNVIQTTTIYGKGSPIQAPDTKEMIGLKAEIDSTKDSVKNYAGFLKSYDTMAEAQQEKLIKAVERRNQAINSAPENLKKVITKVNGLLAGMEDHGGTASDPVVKKKLEAVETSNFKEIALIEQRHRVENTSEQEFKSELLTQELKFLNQKASIYKTGSKEYEEVQKQIQDKLIASGDEGIKIQISQEETKNKAAIAEINKRHLTESTSEDILKADLLAQELKFQAAKMKIYKSGTKEWEEANAKYQEVQVKAEDNINLLILKAKKEFSNSETDNIKDDNLKKKAIEDARWKEELADLKSKLNTKKELSQKDIELNGYYNGIIEQKTITHNKTISDLEISKEDQKKITTLRDAVFHAKTKQELWQGELDLAKEQYDQEFKAADKNRAKELDAEESFKNKVTSIKKEQNATYKMLSEAIVSFVSDTFSGQVDAYASFGENLVLAALGILKQMVPIWSAMIVGGSLATPDSIMSGGVLGIAKFTAILAILEGFVGLAEAGIKSDISKKKDAAQKSSSTTTSKGYAEGGYTGDGDTYETAGTVHKGEFVFSKNDVSNIGLQNLMAFRNKLNLIPQLNPIISSLPNIKLHSNNSRLNEIRSSTTTENTDLSYILNKVNSNIEKSNVIMDKVHGQLKKPLSINKYGHNGLNDSIDDLNKFNRLTK